MPGRRSPPYSGPVSTEPDDEWSPDRVSRFGLLWRIAVVSAVGSLAIFFAGVAALRLRAINPLTRMTASPP